jgi:hypothetical protein
MHRLPKTKETGAEWEIRRSSNKALAGLISCWQSHCGQLVRSSASGKDRWALSASGTSTLILNKRFPEDGDSALAIEQQNCADRNKADRPNPGEQLAVLWIYAQFQPS